MTGPPTSDRASGALTRRGLLRRAGAGVGVAATSGVGLATGQETPSLTTRGIVQEQEVYEQDVTGFWIHLAEELDPAPSGISNYCGFPDWTEEGSNAYDAQMIDRTADPEQQQIAIYLQEATDVAPGALFIVNESQSCEEGYVGLELERVGADLAAVWAQEPGTQTPASDGGGAQPATGETGPGFGVVSGLAGLAGLGWLLGRERSE